MSGPKLNFFTLFFPPKSAREWLKVRLDKISSCCPVLQGPRPQHSLMQWSEWHSTLVSPATLIPTALSADASVQVQIKCIYCSTSLLIEGGRKIRLGATALGIPRNNLIYNILLAVGMQPSGRMNTGNSGKVEKKLLFMVRVVKYWTGCPERLSGDTENPTGNILSNLLSSDQRGWIWASPEIPPDLHNSPILWTALSHLKVNLAVPKIYMNFLYSVKILLES